MQVLDIHSHLVYLYYKPHDMKEYKIYYTNFVMLIFNYKFYVTELKCLCYSVKNCFFGVHDIVFEDF